MKQSHKIETIEDLQRRRLSIKLEQKALTKNLSTNYSKLESRARTSLSQSGNWIKTTAFLLNFFMRPSPKKDTSDKSPFAHTLSGMFTDAKLKFKDLVSQFINH